MHVAECESACMSVFTRSYVRVCVGVAVGERVSCVWACVCVCACAHSSVCACGREVGGVPKEQREGRGGGTRIWRDRKVAPLGGLGAEEEGLLLRGGSAVT